MDNITVSDFSVLRCCLLVSQRVLHPVHVIPLLEIVSGVRASGLFSVLSCVHSHLALNKKVLELQSLNQISVPHVSSVTQLNVVVHLGDLVHFLTSFFK